MQTPKNETNHESAIHIAHVMRSMAPDAFKEIYHFVVNENHETFKKSLWEMLNCTLSDENFSNEVKDRQDFLYTYDRLNSIIDFLPAFFTNACHKVGRP